MCEGGALCPPAPDADAAAHVLLQGWMPEDVIPPVLPSIHTSGAPCRIAVSSPASSSPCCGSMADPSRAEAMSASISAPPGTGMPQDDAAPPDAVRAALTKKEPPPESPQSFRIRSLVIVSFWAIVLLLGLPVWWQTTAIYRARLPLNQMMDWADGRVRNSPLVFPPRRRLLTDR